MKTWDFIDGPFTFFGVILGLFLNLLTIYTMSRYQSLKAKAQQRGSVFQSRHTAKSLSFSSDSSGNKRDSTVRDSEKRKASEQSKTEPNRNSLAPLGEESETERHFSGSAESEQSERKGVREKEEIQSVKKFGMLQNLKTCPPVFIWAQKKMSSGRFSPGGSFFPSRASCKNRVFTFLKWLILTDSAILISTLFLYCLPTLTKHSPSIYLLRASKVAYVAGNAFVMASVWLILALVIDRYLILSRTFTMSTSKSGCNIKLLVLFIYLISLVVAFPRYFDWHLAYNPGSGRASLTRLALSRNQAYVLIYKAIGGAVLYSIIPPILIFVMLSKVWSIMYRANYLDSSRIVLRPARDIIAKISGEYCPIRKFVRTRLHSDETTDSEIILMFLTLKILISRAFPSLLDILEYLTVFHGFSSVISPSAFSNLVHVSNFVIASTSSVNFFIFYIFSSSFRRCFNKKVCGPKKKTRPEAMNQSCRSNNTLLLPP
ncbi:hypothetical protein DdX_14882 [Ditylenchus destructor]|uniref:G-protein coupled receptors family 1 profile domain-containing protein n=1 Tax=Ditylenchus destructor TaxID=166010 RepID=A0AAD4MW02_9BILA|nr:hypothetical protein DdX_14882 [Ditylenchus destructor]